MKPVTRSDLGLAFRKAVLQTDPYDDENNRAGAAMLSVLDDLELRVLTGVFGRMTTDGISIEQLVWRHGKGHDDE